MRSLRPNDEGAFRHPCTPAKGPPGSDPATKRVVRLEHVNIGRRLFTTKKWVEEFIAELTAAKACHPEGIPKTATKKQRLRELQEADEILRRAGI